MWKGIGISIVALLGGLPAYGGEWELIGEKEGIKAYRQSVADSSLHAFRGVKVMDVPIDEAAGVLLSEDVPSKKRWIDMISEFKILTKGKGYAITYSSFDLPWPVSDRDFVVESKRSIDLSNNELRLDIRSVTHSGAKETIGVRGEIHLSSWRLKALPGGKKTLVDIQVLSDPKGLLPDWLVNQIQKDWPFNTLSAFEREVKRGWAKPHPELKALRKKAEALSH